MDHYPTMAPPSPPSLRTMRLPAPPSSPNTIPETQLSTAPVEPTISAPSKRTGAQNSSQCGVAARFSKVEKIESIDGNDWTTVAKEFADWALANVRPVRDATSLKENFDRLA